MMIFNPSIMNRILDLNASFGNNHGDVFLLGETIDKEIKIIPHQDLNIDYLGYQLILEARGKISTTQKVLFTKYLLKASQLTKGKEYTFNIKFTNNETETFSGRNLSLIARLEFFVRTPDKIESEESNLLSKLVNTFKDNSEFIKTIYLRFKSKSALYQVDSPPSKLYTTTSNSLILFAFFGCFFLFILGLNKGWPTLYGVAIGLMVLAVIFGYLFPFLLVGNIRIRYSNEGNHQFRLCLGNDRKWRAIQELKIRYAVREEVLDTRGTTTSKIIEQLFWSSESVKKNPLNEECFLFDFPKKKNMPCTVAVGDSRIYWVVILKVRLFLGFSYTYEDEFIVKK